MKKVSLVILFSFLFLISAAYGTWRLILRSIPPETPKVTVTIPEGWHVIQVNEHLREKGVLAEGGLPAELEGYLFPDTYEFFLDSSVEVVADRFEANLNRYLEELGVDANGDELVRIITMASLIEKEVQDPAEKRIAAGVLWKRLENDMPLQVDATICYLKQVNGNGCLPISAADKKIDSPYNTYLYRGLPPGPIANPGLDAIRAAVQPASSPYWYYISDPKTGQTIFARTLDEHSANIVKYLSE